MRRITKIQMPAILMLGMASAIAQHPETDPDRVIQQAEDALRRWEARLDARASGGGDSKPGSETLGPSRAQAVARLAELQDYVSEMAAAQTIFESNLERHRQAVGVRLRQAMQSWPGPSDDATIVSDDVPTLPRFDAGPSSSGSEAPGSAGKVDAAAPITNGRRVSEDLETELRRQFKAEDDDSLESTLKSLLQDNN